MKKSAGLRLSFRSSVLTLALAAAPLACSDGASGGGAPVDQGGTIGLRLSSPGISLASVSYVITGPGGFAQSGTIDVSRSSTVAAVLGPLPAASGYTIALSATPVSGPTSCSGSAGFSVLAHQRVPVTVGMLCHELVKTGSVLVDGTLNLCATLTDVSASPSETSVGGALSLAADAIDSDGPGPVTYSWLATGGVIAAPNARQPSFTCTAVGLVTVTVSVSDGDAACVETGSVTVSCTPAPDGAGGAGAGGAGAGGAGAGGAGAGGAGAGGVRDLVVYRVGTGTGSLVNTGNPVFVDEFSPTGALVKSTALPTSGSGTGHSLVASGTATSEGLMTLSLDGHYVVLTGYDSALPGPSLAGSSVPRVVGRLDAAGLVDTTTAMTDFASGNNPRSAASSNGTDLWIAGGAGGVRYTTLGATSSTQLSTTVTNIRQVNLFGSQLYASDSSGAAVRVGTVGSGLPTTSGQTIANLPGFPTSGSPYGFFLADLDAGTPGLDTLYVADDGAGVTKYGFDGSTWTAQGTIGTGSDAYRGLTGLVAGGTVTLFATRKGGSGASGGGELVTLVDSTGRSGALSATPTLLVTAAANTAFRGVALAPLP